MACPKARDYARMKVTMVRLQQGFAPSKMGFQVKLQGNNFKPPMSALGHKRISEQVRIMSALPPEADIVQRDR
jgi:hypothetical protein